MGVPSDYSLKHPFADSVDPEILYRSPMHETVCAELFTAGKTHAGLLVLSGEPGTGKSIVLRRVARDLEEAGGRVLWCDEILSLHEAFGQVGGGPGVPDTATRAEALLATMQARVRSSSATVVVVDEAQRLDSGELGILCDLAEAGGRSGSPLAVLLVGLPELDVKLAHLVGNKTGRASTFHARLSRLEISEVRAYIAYRLEREGLSLDRLFQAEAVERVAVYAEGIPRVINHLCSGALHGARESGLTMVSAPAVDAAAYWLGLPPPGGAPLTGAWRGTRRRLRRSTARGVLAGRRTLRAWSSGMALAAGAWRGTRRRLRRSAARGVLAGHRTLRAWSSGMALAAGAWRGTRRSLRRSAARGVLAGRRTLRAWLPGIGLAALGLGAIAVFFAPRPTPQPPSSPPQQAATLQDRPSKPPQLGPGPGVPIAPPKTAQVIERPPPPATPRRERPLDTVPVPRPAAREETRSGTPPRLVSGAPASPPAHRGFSAAVALVQSAEAGNLTEVLDIIDAGVSPNARDTLGMTPLMLAVIHDHGPVAEVLLTRDADVNAVDDSGVTALMLAANNARTVLLQRLLARGANVNAQTRTGWTALIYAAWKGHPSIVRRLIEFGADPALLDRTGRTALQYATWRGADPANPSARDDPAPPAVAHRRYVEVIDVLSKASRRR